jgi:hypothetical protein
LGQEFFIKSEDLESKIRQLLPSQGGLGAGFDLSASTQIVPIIDLTESAEGSNIREDLQKAFSHANTIEFFVTDTTSTVTSTTGYWRVFGVANGIVDSGGTGSLRIGINNGSSTNNMFRSDLLSSSTATTVSVPFDFIVYLPAGNSLVMFTSNASTVLSGAIRQIATIDGELVNP